MDFIVVVFSIICGFLFIQSFKNKLASDHLSTLRLIFVYHILFGLYNYFFFGSDPVRYWALAKTLSYQDFVTYIFEKSGTYFMFALDYYPSQILGLSYFTGTMIYTTVGFIAIAYFYIIALELVPYNSKFKGYNLFPLLFFLPNLHLWTCTAGKDTISFFCGAIFCYGLLKPYKRLPLLIIALIFSYAVRPHIALFLVTGYGLGFALSSKVTPFKRFLYATVFIAAAFFILPSVMQYAKIEEATLDSFSEFSGNKAGLLSRSTTGSRIDISSYPLPLKLFTFLYRPLFFDINGIPALLASIENLFLLVLSFRVFKSKPIETFRKAPMPIKGMLLYLFIGTLAFSQTLGNLGIIIRMRNMFLPGLIIYFLWSFSYATEKGMKKTKIIKLTPQQ
ncbi:hypothetical protein [Flavobacterium sp.]|uniref:hypothetical protein n=1 Tax=Flavobacterium sp. TaxID=239 RepID=UPI0025F6AA5E|nr:hypothetical protein [Flavobacterium sp.]